MTTAEVLDLFRYNAWANERIASSLLRLPPGALLQDLGGSFPSARDTFAHLIAAEWIWIRHWSGRSPAAGPQWATSTDLSLLIGQLREIETERAVFLEGLSESDLGAPCSFTLLSGTPASFALGDLLLHAVNHSTYHRGQLAAMLRRLGSPALATDFLVYRIEAKP